MRLLAAATRGLTRHMGDGPPPPRHGSAVADRCFPVDIEADIQDACKQFQWRVLLGKKPELIAQGAHSSAMHAGPGYRPPFAFTTP